MITKIFGDIKRFLTEVYLELKKVKWPTKKETVKLTLIVFIVSVVLGAYIGGIDFLLTKIIEMVVR